MRPNKPLPRSVQRRIQHLLGVSKNGGFRLHSVTREPDHPGSQRRYNPAESQTSRPFRLRARYCCRDG